MKMHFSHLTGPYKADLDTGAMKVEITGADGPIFKNGDSSMRISETDAGFEIFFWRTTPLPLSNGPECRVDVPNSETRLVIDDTGVEVISVNKPITQGA